MSIERILEVAGSAAGVDVWRRVFGPSLDEVGDTLRQYTANRLPNIQRVVENADGKSAAGPETAAPPRAILAILEQATVAEDEVMADYLGGILASARDTGNDDAVVWTSLISRMSSAELHLHYALYSALREVAIGAKLNLGIDVDRNKLRFFVPYEGDRGLMAALGGTAFMRLGPTIFGLFREGLLENKQSWAFGDVEAVKQAWHVAPAPGCVVSPAAQGLLLFLWGLGVGARDINAYLSGDFDLTTSTELDNLVVPMATLVSPLAAFHTPDLPGSDVSVD